MRRHIIDENKPKRFISFYAKLCEKENLIKAWNAVYSNGLQSQSPQARDRIKEYKSQETQRLTKLHKSLKDKTFKPIARGTPIDPKGKGKFRPVVSYEIDARIVQRCMLNIIQNHSSAQKYLNVPTSFGGIKRKGVSDAVEKTVRTFKDRKYTHYITTDIRSFFTQIKVDRVLDRIKAFCKSDDYFLQCLEETMKIEIANLEDIKKNHQEFLEKYAYTEEGVPQGSCLSPLFGNIYLYDIDYAMNANDEVACFRYIDDVVIIGSSFVAVRNAFFKTLVPMLIELGLSVYLPDDKNTKFCQGEIKNGFDYLGVHITDKTIKPSKNAFKKIESEIDKLLTDALNFGALGENKNLYQTLDLISRKLKGWGNHYWFCNAGREVKGLDSKISAMIAKFTRQYNKKLLNLKDSDKIRRQLGVQCVVDCKKESKIPIIDKLNAEKEESTKKHTR